VIRVASVDADAHPGLGHDYDVKGFPTLKYFAAGDKTPTEYTGGRTAESLVSFLNDKLGLHVAVPESADFDAESATKAASKAAFAYPSVTHINSSNVDQIIGGPVGVLVEFYAVSRTFEVGDVR
jgi:hypothetical protein